MKRNDGMHDLALLVVRSVVGGSIAAHGAQKLLGWFGGPGIEGASQMMQSVGFQPGERYARLAALSELAAGIAIATGTGGPIGPALLLGVMATAAGSVHLKNGYWNQNHGFELNTIYGMLALLLAVDDHGSLSMDRMTGIRRANSSGLGWLALAAAGAGAAYVLSQRSQTPQVKSEEQPAQSEHGTIESQNAASKQPT